MEWETYVFVMNLCLSVMFVCAVAYTGIVIWEIVEAWLEHRREQALLRAFPWLRHWK